MTPTFEDPEVQAERPSARWRPAPNRGTAVPVSSRPSFERLAPSFARASLATVLVLGCGFDGPALGPGGVGGAPPGHRVVGLRCAATNPVPADGNLPCTKDDDCLVDGGPTLARFCRGGTCNIDQCFADEDCPAGTACGCSSQVSGLGQAGNSCLPSSCRSDADCAETRLCSPTRGGLCGSLSGYQCRTGAYTCHADRDCPASSGGIYDFGSKCDYAPEVGQWQCIVVRHCGG